MRGHAASIVADGEPCSAQQGSSVSAFAPGVFEAADHCSSYSAPLPSMATESTWRGTRDTARSGSAMSPCAVPFLAAQHSCASESGRDESASDRSDAGSDAGSASAPSGRRRERRGSAPRRVGKYVAKKLGLGGRRRRPET